MAATGEVSTSPNYKTTKTNNMPLDPKQSMGYYTIDNTLPVPLIPALTGNSYLARIAQSGTNAPTAIEDTNNTITGITYTREGAGAYSIHAPTDTFTANKTWIILGPSNSPFDTAYIRCYYNSEEQLTLESYSGVAADNVITDITLLIIVTT